MLPLAIMENALQRPDGIRRKRSEIQTPGRSYSPSLGAPMLNDNEFAKMLTD